MMFGRVDQRAARESLKAAKQALREGATRQARKHAREAVRYDPYSEDGWLILAGLAEGQAGLAYAQRALEINPSSEKASRAVTWFSQQISIQEAQPTTMMQPEPSIPLESMEPTKVRGAIWQDALKAFLRHKAAVFGLVIVILFLLIAFFAPWITPYDPDLGSFMQIREDPMTRFEPDEETLALCHWQGTFLEPGCSIYLLGTDRVGRDLWTRTIYAARTSLIVAFVASAVSLSIGMLYGTLAGYIGGQTDELMMRFVDFLYSLPVFLIVIGIQSFFRLFWIRQEGVLGALDELNREMGGLLFLFIAIGAVNWVGMARLSRAMVHTQKTRDYILAAHSIGTGEAQIILRHLLPNILGPLFVMETIAIPGYIFLEATLSFIGLGVHTTSRGGTTGIELPSWGVMIREGYPGLRTAPYLVLLPSIALTLLTLGFNFLGDGLRDAMDPTSRNKR
jgi:oligopeptide transport system permease protein